MVVVCSEKNI